MLIWYMRGAAYAGNAWGMTANISRAFPIHSAISQFALRRDTLHERSSIAQAYLSTLYSGDESDLLPAILALTHFPYLGNELIAGLDRTGEPGLILPDVSWITPAQGLQQGVSSRVPAKEPVHDSATKAHLLTWLWSGVEWIIISV